MQIFLLVVLRCRAIDWCIFTPRTTLHLWCVLGAGPGLCVGLGGWPRPAVSPPGKGGTRSPESGGVFCPGPSGRRAAAQLHKEEMEVIEVILVAGVILVSVKFFRSGD